MKTGHIFLLVFFAAVISRLILNFSIPLVPGIGGGYTILQIREVLEEGHLALPDMPLVFYFNAFIVKLLSIVFPNADTNVLIIIVLKVFDSLGLPMLLYPLYKTQSALFQNSFSSLFLIAISGFAVLSYSPLDLTSDAVKNSLGLAFMTFFIYFFLSYLKYKKKKDVLMTLLFLVLTCLTHFGSFAVSLSILVAGLIVVYRKKALLPILGITIAGVLLVAVFDPDRAKSLGTFWVKVFSIFISPRVLSYPQGIFNYISSFFLIIFIIKVIRRNREGLSVYKRNVLLILLIVLIILSFPFYSFEYGRRLGFFLFIPQSFALLFLYPDFSERVKRVISFLIILLVVFTASVKLLQPKPMAITEEAYSDMKRIGNEIQDPERTLIFARHGLEWWLAWEHHVNIAMQHIEIDEGMRLKYDHIYFLVQKKGENHHYPGKTSPFKEPTAPENSEPVYNSEFFEIYELQKE